MTPPTPACGQAQGASPEDSLMRWPCMGLAAVAAAGIAAELPPWTAAIRPDHPRLFFNRDTWPAVRDRAVGPEKAWCERIRTRVDRLLPETQAGDPAPRELGPEAAWAAFLFRLTGQDAYRQAALSCLRSSIAFYEQRLAERKAVDWYSTSRVHATLAWDWLYDDIPEPERPELMSRLVRVIDGVLKARPPIPRENLSGYTTGFYGVHNCLWFIGCTAFGTGIETDRVNEWLVWGHDENLRLLEHRRKACGADGGAASPTLGYAFGAYPWAEQNFFYTWLSSTGENIAPQWPHSARFANYVIWNWIAAEPYPLEFGCGDTPHTSNRLPIGHLYSHMRNIRHLFGTQYPQGAALARYVEDLLPPASRVHSSAWFIYPFLMTNLDASPPAAAPERLPRARFFEQMGQLFMRSGTGPDDTYALFTCGGALAQHRHYDALNLVIYHRGYLALDSGTRHREFENGQHLANYFAQSVAHNVVLIHQPGEPPARYWGGSVEANHGGQHRQIGSALNAFAHTEEYVYAAGDATACYLHGPVRREGQPDLPEKCSLAARQVLFLIPDRFVVFDRVVATDPSYRKEWLLHTAHEPLVQGYLTRADHDRGRLFCRTLLPEDAAVTVLGGPGKAYWAAGRNWDIAADDLKPEQLALVGQWRVEVAPGAPRTEDLFLHVFQVGSRDRAAMDPVRLVREGTRVGAELAVNKRTWTVLFDTAGGLGGRLRATGQGEPLDVPLPDTVQTADAAR